MWRNEVCQSPRDTVAVPVQPMPPAAPMAAAFVQPPKECLPHEGSFGGGGGSVAAGARPLSPPLQRSPRSCGVARCLGATAPAEDESTRRRGITLTREGWSSRRPDKGRNNSPGVTALWTGSESASGLDAGGEERSRDARSVGSVGLRRHPPTYRSTAVEAALKHEDCAGAGAGGKAEPTSFVPEQSRRCRSPRGYHQFQASDGVRLLMRDPHPRSPEEEAALPTAPERRKWPHRAPSPGAVVPWGADIAAAAAADDGGVAAAPTAKGLKLTDVARSAMESAALRVQAEKLHLRDFDMHSNFLGSGFQASMEYRPAPQRKCAQGSGSEAAHGHADRASGKAVEQCRDQLAGAVAALLEAKGTVADVATASNAAPQMCALTSSPPQRLPRVDGQVGDACGDDKVSAPASGGARLVGGA